jgi:NAD(P) transhydrogenase subunit alpha
MVEGMKSGSVIMDLAAESGGNCEVTQVGEEVRHHGVLVLGPRNLPGSMPTHASQLYARNVETLLLHLTSQGELALDLEDEINAGCVITHGGQVVHPRIRPQASA